ncbi:unnamed protein product [Schistosoma intercalatum]|nr:unnamed protein product [Schistosoma intercalatum]CAH8586590.1 unnamed protein product [Schistosoma intercalatum]
MRKYSTLPIILFNSHDNSMFSYQYYTHCLFTITPSEIQTGTLSRNDFHISIRFHPRCFYPRVFGSHFQHSCQ